VNKKKVVIPHEHGGWAMVSVPFLIGMLAGTPRWGHLPLFFAWLFLYLASYPLLQAVKRTASRRFWFRWGALYGAVALACLAQTLSHEPQLFWFLVRHPAPGTSGDQPVACQATLGAGARQ
jgi:hypothetical protein